jgi:Dolichyl-phosphate-mannose-protein mannosyltransferase
MTATIESPSRVYRPRHAMRRRAVAPRVATAVAPWATVAVVVIVALVLRVVNIRRSYDVFIDEVTYTRITSSIATGQGVRLSGVPFDLHPPAALALYALVDRLFSLPSATLPLLLDLRLVPAVLGAMACGALYLLLRRAVPPAWALVAALGLAIDPFAILYDSRVLLEAPAQLAAVATIGCLAAAVGRERTASGRWSIAGAGLFGAITLCTKETFGVVLVLTLLALCATGWSHERRRIFVVGAVAAGGYAINVVCLGISTGFSSWWHAQTGGVARLVGTEQTTGFNASTTHVTLVSRVFADAGDDAITYLVLVLGVLAGAVMVWRAWRRRSAPNQSVPARIGVLVALWTVAGAAYLAYATVFGTIEAQMYYICLLPCVATLALFASSCRPSWSRDAKRALAVVVALAMVFDAVAWVRVHTTRDDDYVRMVSWETTHLPKGSVVAATENTAQFLLQDVAIGQWHTPAAFRVHHVDYVVVSTTLTDQGYALATPALLTWLDRHARLVFEVDGATTGHLEVFDVRALDGSSG